MAASRPKPSWQFFQRSAGLTIVGAVMVGWFLGLPISDPGVLALLGIASWLLGVNAAVSLRKENGSGHGGSRSSSKPPDASSD